jgi:hypothetical protein
VDVFFTRSEEKWWEKGEAVPPDLQPCSCGYFLKYRIHDCPRPDKNWNLLLTDRHRVWGNYRYKGERYQIYTCNGLPWGWEDLDVTQSNHDQLLELVREVDGRNSQLRYLRGNL